MAIIGQKKMENMLYLALWIFLFAMPAISFFIHNIGSPENVQIWDRLLETWIAMAVFCLVFVLHNMFMAPLLVYRNKPKAYVGALLPLIICFQFYQCTTRPIEPDGMEYAVPQHEHKPKDLGKPGGYWPGHRGNGKEKPPQPKPIKRVHPPMVFGGQDVVGLVIMLLLLALNIGVKLYFRSFDERKRMRDLERRNLQQQLDYLKYQISPHFFMNTLNNIHALVDIDAEEAKHTIEVLSKLMRYMLYESSSDCAPLQKEINFLSCYIELMRIRYTDKLKLTVDFPADVPNRFVPPLIFATFVENAFKHGVSYERPSFISVCIKVDEKGLTFVCRNSRNPDDTKIGGVGLKNTRQRLDLIYSNKYSLLVNSEQDQFCVKLRMPYIENKTKSKTND